MGLQEDINRPLGARPKSETSKLNADAPAFVPFLQNTAKFLNWDSELKASPNSQDKNTNSGLNVNANIFVPTRNPRIKQNPNEATKSNLCLSEDKSDKKDMLGAIINDSHQHPKESESSQNYSTPVNSEPYLVLQQTTKSNVSSSNQKEKIELHVAESNDWNEQVEQELHSDNSRIDSYAKNQEFNSPDNAGSFRTAVYFRNKNKTNDNKTEQTGYQNNKENWRGRTSNRYERTENYSFHDSRDKKWQFGRFKGDKKVFSNSPSEGTENFSTERTNRFSVLNKNENDSEPYISHKNENIEQDTSTSTDSNLQDPRHINNYENCKSEPIEHAYNNGGKHYPKGTNYWDNHNRSKKNADNWREDKRKSNYDDRSQDMRPNYNRNRDLNKNNEKNYDYRKSRSKKWESNESSDKIVSSQNLEDESRSSEKSSSFDDQNQNKGSAVEHERTANSNWETETANNNWKTETPNSNWETETANSNWKETANSNWETETANSNWETETQQTHSYNTPTQNIRERNYNRDEEISTSREKRYENKYKQDRPKKYENNDKYVSLKNSDSEDESRRPDLPNSHRQNDTKRNLYGNYSGNKNQNRGHGKKTDNWKEVRQKSNSYDNYDNSHNRSMRSNSNRQQELNKSSENFIPEKSRSVKSQNVESENKTYGPDLPTEKAWDGDRKSNVTRTNYHENRNQNRSQRKTNNDWREEKRKSNHDESSYPQDIRERNNKSDRQQELSTVGEKNEEHKYKRSHGELNENNDKSISWADSESEDENDDLPAKNLHENRKKIQRFENSSEEARKKISNKWNSNYDSRNTRRSNDNWRETDDNSKNQRRKNHNSYREEKFQNQESSRISANFDAKFSQVKNYKARLSDPKMNKANDSLTNDSFECMDDDYHSFNMEYTDEGIDNGKVQEQTADLFEMPTEYSLAHCVAEDMRMGEGIAVDFKRIFNQVDVLLGQEAKKGELALLEDKTETGTRYIYYLVTKKVSSGKPTYETFWSSLKKMRDHIHENKVEKLAIPRLGCGLDRLEWHIVKSMIEYLFKDVDVEIVTCNFFKEKS